MEAAIAFSSSGSLLSSSSSNSDQLYTSPPSTIKKLDLYPTELFENRVDEVRRTGLSEVKIITDEILDFLQDQEEAGRITDLEYGEFEDMFEDAADFIKRHRKLICTAIDEGNNGNTNGENGEDECPDDTRDLIFAIYNWCYDRCIRLFKLKGKVRRAYKGVNSGFRSISAASASSISAASTSTADVFTSVISTSTASSIPVTFSTASSTFTFVTSTSTSAVTSPTSAVTSTSTSAVTSTSTSAASTSTSAITSSTSATSTSTSAITSSTSATSTFTSATSTSLARDAKNEDLMKRFSDSLSHVTWAERNIAMAKFCGISETDAIMNEIKYFFLRAISRGDVDFFDVNKFIARFPHKEKFIKEYYEFIRDGVGDTSMGIGAKYLILPIEEWCKDYGVACFPSPYVRLQPKKPTDEVKPRIESKDEAKAEVKAKVEEKKLEHKIGYLPLFLSDKFLESLNNLSSSETEEVYRTVHHMSECEAIMKDVETMLGFAFKCGYIAEIDFGKFIEKFPQKELFCESYYYMRDYIDGSNKADIEAEVKKYVVEIKSWCESWCEHGAIRECDHHCNPLKIVLNWK